MNFNTVLYNIKSPQNVGMIVRSHVAFGGDKLIFVGYEKPWDFKKGSQAFSRKLETRLDILFFTSIDDYFKWSYKNNFKSIAIEIGSNSNKISDIKLEKGVNIILGNEAKGIPNVFLERVDKIVTIEQFGQVGSLNVAVAGLIVLHALGQKSNKKQIDIKGNKFSGEQDF